MNWIILPQDQIDQMVEVQDFLLTNQSGTSVADIRKIYGITSEEYNMIFDLTMPRIRENNLTEYWKTKSQYLYSRVADRLRKKPIRKEDKKLADDIWKIMEDASAVAKLGTKKEYHKVRYQCIYNNLSNRIMGEKVGGEERNLADDILIILEDSKVGELNIVAHEDIA